MTMQTPTPTPSENKKMRSRRRRLVLAMMLAEKEEAPATAALSGGGRMEEEMGEGGGAGYTPSCHQGSGRLAPCDLLDDVSKSGWSRWSRPRSARKRGIWSLNIEQMLLPNHLRNLRCFQNLHSASKGKKRGQRRNNDHWTTEEVKELVDGVFIFGVGHWTKLKNESFSTSVAS